MTIILRCPQETKPGYLPCVSAVISLWKSKQEAGCKYVTCSSPFSCPKKCKQEYSWNCLAWGPATSCLNFDNTDSSNPRTWYFFPTVCVIFDFFHQHLIVFWVQVWHQHKTNTDQRNRTENPAINLHTCGQSIIDKRSKNTGWGKDSLLNKWCQENWQLHVKEWH